MKVDVPQAAERFAKLIAESGPMWRHDYRVRQWITGMSDSAAVPSFGFNPLDQALSDLESLINAEGPDWLSDWFTKREVDRVLGEFWNRGVDPTDADEDDEDDDDHHEDDDDQRVIYRDRYHVGGADEDLSGCALDRCGHLPVPS